MPKPTFFRIIAAILFCVTGGLLQAEPVTFGYTGSQQSYVVPKGVSSVAIDLQGATGGSSRFSRGGFGGRVQCVLAVTPGTILYVYVGGAGKNWNSAAAGYNGGSESNGSAAGGGGASDIRIGGNALSNRVIVAGGGGGAGTYYTIADADRGGNGGGLTGENGYNEGRNDNGFGGNGGSTTREGRGAEAEYYYGNAGVAAMGGIGAHYYDGGGGGGGYLGGGGGAMGGGGGGSSYSDPLLTSSIVHTHGYNAAGSGRLVITPSSPAAYGHEASEADTAFKQHGSIVASVFCDFAYKAHADTILEGRSGISQYAKVPAGVSMFQFRRIAIGYNYEASKKFSMEFLLASEEDFAAPLYASSGDLLLNGKLAPFVKLANVRWRNIFNGTDLVAGQLYTPAFHNTSEEAWAYRSIARTLTDIYRTNEYDRGIALQGHIGASGRLGYNVLAGNGSGPRPEGNMFKWFYGDVYYKFLHDRLIVDFYADYEQIHWTPDWHHDRQMNKIFVAYRVPKFTVGLEMFTNRLMGDNIATRTDGITKDTLTTHRMAFSVFVHGRIDGNKLGFFARFDKYSWNADKKSNLFQAYDAQTSVYDHNSRQDFATLGLDYSPVSNVHIMPNVWYNYYENTSPSGYGDGNKDYDLVYRLTVAYQIGK